MQLIRFYFSVAFMPSIKTSNLLFAELSFTLFSKMEKVPSCLVALIHTAVHPTLLINQWQL